jgi:hypothetical protein
VWGMDGVTTAIVGFIFVCIIFPHLIKNRTQYFISIAIVLAALVMQSIAVMVGHEGFGRFVRALSILFEAVTVALLVMASGGLSIGQLAGEMGRAIDVVRRGEEEKEVIVPLPESMQKFKRDKEDAPRVREEIGDVGPKPAKPPPDRGPISMD